MEDRLSAFIPVLKGQVFGEFSNKQPHRIGDGLEGQS